MNTDRLILRRPAVTDLDRHFAIYSDPETNLYNPAGPVADLAASAKILNGWIAHWDSHGFGQHAVATKECPDHVIGFSGIAFKDYAGRDHLNLGYRFGQDGWGQGYATEAAVAVLDEAFGMLGCDAIFAIVRPANAPSIKLLERVGMERHGTLDDVPGQPHSLMYRALKPNHDHQMKG